MAKALSHPARVLMLQLIDETGGASASDGAAASSFTVPDLTYHVRALQAAGFVKPVARRRVRGAVEHFYGLTDAGKAAVRITEIILRVSGEAVQP